MPSTSTACLVEGIPAPQARAEWRRVDPELQRVLSRWDMGLSADDVLEQIEQRNMQLWTTGTAYAITRIVRHKQFSVLEIPFVAGDGLAEWLPDLFHVLHAFAHHHSCKYLEGFGREGWIRILKPFGFERYSITVRCPVNGR